MSGCVSAPSVAKRSVLYGREPAGVGTELVESLSGYLVRLCVARSVRITDVLDQLVRPLVPQDVLPPLPEISWYLVQGIVDMDGVGSRAFALVRAMECLTGRADLALHTFVPWSGLLAPSRAGAVRRRAKRWCARCLESWHADGVEPWEPLLWRLAPVEWCPLHRVPLSQRCPSCGRTLRVATERVPPGHCERCGALLHVGDPLLRRGALDARGSLQALWGWWVSVALGRMLRAQGEALRRASPVGFARLIAEATERPRVGVQPLARRLGTTVTTLYRWRDRECQPRLSVYLATCMRLGADPAHIGIAGHGPLFDDVQCPWRRVFRPWHRLCLSPRRTVLGRGAGLYWTGVAARCDRVIEAGDWRTVADVAGALGISVATFRHRLPERYAVVVELCKDRRAREREALRERCRHGLDRALAVSGSTSACSVARCFGVQPGDLRRWYPERYARLVEASAAWRARQRRHRILERRRAVHGAVAALTARGESPSLQRVVRAAGLTEKLRADPDVRAAWREALDACGVVARRSASR